MSNVAEVVYHVAVSLDGFIAQEGGLSDWLVPYQCPEAAERLALHYKSFDGILLGGGTYEIALKQGQLMGATSVASGKP